MRHSIVRRSCSQETPHEDASAHASLTALAHHVRVGLNAANPVLTPTTALDSLKSATAACRDKVGTFEGDHQNVYMMNAWKDADDILAVLNALPIIKTKKDTRGVPAGCQPIHRPAHEDFGWRSCTDDIGGGSPRRRMARSMLCMLQRP